MDLSQGLAQLCRLGREKLSTKSNLLNKQTVSADISIHACLHTLTDLYTGIDACIHACTHAASQTHRQPHRHIHYAYRFVNPYFPNPDTSQSEAVCDEPFYHVLFKMGGMGGGLGGGEYQGEGGAEGPTGGGKTNDTRL